MAVQYVQNPDGTVVAVGVPINSQAVVIQAGPSGAVAPYQQGAPGVVAYPQAQGGYPTAGPLPNKGWCLYLYHTQSPFLPFFHPPYVVNKSLSSKFY